MPHALDISPLGDLEIVMVRAFDAPRDLVFDAWTRPRILRQWLGVRDGWTMPICNVDLRIGGAYRFAWRKRDAEMGVRGVYREVVRPERIVNTEIFDEPWYDGEALITLVLDEEGGKTTCTMTMLYESSEARDQVLASPMEQGLAEAFSLLDALIAEKSR